jgi:hypothetical protein
MNNFDEGSSSFESGFSAGSRFFGQHLCPTESVPARAGRERWYTHGLVSRLPGVLALLAYCVI